MKILGLDLAGRCGYGHGERAGPFQFGAFDLPGFDDLNRAKSYAGAYSIVQALVRENDIEAVVIEAPLMTVTRKNKRGISTPTSSHGTRVLTMLSGAAQAAAFSGGARRFWMPEPSQWRKQVLGAGYPDDPKVAALRYCRLVLKLDVADHNSAEGLCLMAYGHGQARLF